MNYKYLTIENGINKLEAFFNAKNEISICIIEEGAEFPCTVSLDKEDAIALKEELELLINEME